jgi:predicted metal-dependent peptidase
VTLQNPYQILAAARLLVYDRAPYFRAGILQLVPRETPGLGTFATTKNWIMLYDPEKAVEYGVEGTAAVIVHELWHLIRDHFDRFSAPLINQDVANIATDLSINPGIRQMGFTLPATAIWPIQVKLADNLTAEQYYEKLMKMDIQYTYHLEDGTQCDEKGKPLKGKGQGQGEGKEIKISGCGSCSGRPIPHEPEDGDQEGRSANEARRTKIIIAKSIKEHRGRGTMPSELERWAESMLKPPRVRWEEKLARACRAAVAYRPGSGHSTYARVSRRQAGLGFGPGCPVLPSFRATTPRVTLLVDTSGSMSQDDLARVMGEAQGIFKACNASLDVMVCDAAVHGSKKVRSIKEACQMLKGGGGSDFRPAFDLLSTKKPRNDIVVAATDGDITVPRHAPPGINVIWLLVGGYKHKPCNWGTFIEIDDV